MNLEIHINNVRGSQMAAKITGTFTIDEHSFRFTAIAFGRIGGQNVGAKISKTTEKELKKLGYDSEEVILSLQKNLLQGNLTLPEGLKRESFVDD
ncbi:MAG: hypothetical protein NPMRTH1_1430015 [Nitrosopumilales archaeon]|nr:MAG: hypothetical protein NPMRTH1_1430015 [Nitrosopumilales archaeon]